MKAKKLLATVCISLSLCLALALVPAISHQTAQAGTAEHAARILSQAAVGDVASGMPVFGSTELVVSGANALNLSGTASTSIPCNEVLIYASTTGCMIGSTSASATFPLSTGLQSLKIPATNVNQIWCKVSSGTVTVEACYAK